MNPDNSRAGRLLVACTALLLVPACMAGTVDSDAGEVKGGPTVRVALGVDASYAPFYLAKERGMFAKAGVNVELMRTEGGPPRARRSRRAPHSWRPTPTPPRCR